MISDKQRRHLFKLNSNQKGKNNRGWKGGKYKNLGYVLVYSPNHPYATQRGYVREHILVMEKVLGRYIQKGEIICHINNNRSDNRITNLKLFKKEEFYHLLHNGRKRSEKTKEKISNAKKGLHTKENNPNWQGGKSFELYTPDFSKELKEKIRKRDGYKCQECGLNQKDLISERGRKYKLHVHHIDYNKKNNNPENLISLCGQCHIQANFKREDWTNYFKNKMENLKFGLL